MHCVLNGMQRREGVERGKQAGWKRSNAVAVENIDMKRDGKDEGKDDAAKQVHEEDVVGEYVGWEGGDAVGVDILGSNESGEDSVSLYARTKRDLILWRGVNAAGSREAIALALRSMSCWLKEGASRTQ